MFECPRCNELAALRQALEKWAILQAQLELDYAEGQNMGALARLLQLDTGRGGNGVTKEGLNTGNDLEAPGIEPGSKP
jgi:hypothetical protein